MPFHTINFGQRNIEFKLQYSDRKTLGISVLPDLSVVVTAPSKSDFGQVEDLIKKRAAWILKQQTKFSEYLPAQPERKYVSGETHRYLGRQYRLKVIEGDLPEVKLKGRYIYITVADRTETEKIKESLEKWYYAKAKKYFQQKLNKIFEKFRRYEIELPSIRLRRMSKRWGTCNGQGVINLNGDLIKFSPACIEYVITHELCHLVEANHNQAFYRLLQRKMPNWREIKLRLEQSK